MSLALPSGKHAAPIGSSPRSAHLLHWLIGFGGVGLFGISIVDSSIFPLPIPGTTDLLLLILVVHPGVNLFHVCAFVFAAVSGAVIGGSLTWNTGKKGGMPALEKRVSSRILRRITDWSNRHGILAVFIAALLPPPIPLLPFLLAAGALGISFRNFLLSFTLARTLRYGIIGYVGFTYGHQVIRVWRQSIADWSTPILCTYGALIALGIAYGTWKYLKNRRA